MQPIYGVGLLVLFIWTLAFLNHQLLADRKQRDKAASDQRGPLAQKARADGALPDEAPLPALKPARVSVGNLHVAAPAIHVPAGEAVLPSRADPAVVLSSDLDSEVITYDDLVDAPELDAPLDNQCDALVLELDEIDLDGKEPSDASEVYDTEMEDSVYDAQYAEAG